MSLTTPPAIDHYSDSPAAATPTPQSIQSPKFELGQCVQYKEGQAYGAWEDPETNRIYYQLPVTDYQEVKGTYLYTVGDKGWTAFERELEPCTDDKRTKE